MNTLTYRGYTAKIEFDAEDEIFVGRILGINDVIGFHAEAAKELKPAFETAVEDYIATCEKIGKEPEKSYSGKLMLRVTPELHRDAAIAAEAADQSLNEWGSCALVTALAADAEVALANGGVRVVWGGGKLLADNPERILRMIGADGHAYDVDASAILRSGYVSPNDSLLPTKSEPRILHSTAPGRRVVRAAVDVPLPSSKGGN